MARQTLGLFRWLIKFYLFPLRFRPIFNYALNRAFKKEFWDYYYGNFLMSYPHIYRSIVRIKSERPVIFDVGGGTGTTAELYLKGNVNSTIVVFEPIPSNASEIRRRFNNHDQIKVINKAAGESEFETVINVAKRVTSSSLLNLSPEKLSANGYLSDSLHPDHLERISVVRLDSFFDQFDNIDVLKLDVQGYEIKVLKGCSGNIKKVKQIVVEVNNHEGYQGAEKYFEVDEYLRTNGFVLAEFFPSCMENGLIREWDCIYVKE